MRVRQSGPGLYIHVPFCKSLCGYCDFVHVVDRGERAPLIHAITEEAAVRGVGDLDPETLYLGGGTPSLLNESELLLLLEITGRDHAREVTFEANPDDITRPKLQVWKNAGVNRISLGVQCMVDEELAAVSRRHGADDNRMAMKSVSESFANWSVDLLVGLPGQTPRTFDLTLKEVIAYSPPHISLYYLEWKGAPRFALDHDLQSDLLVHGWRTLASAGYQHYEVSNFCRNKQFSLHNLNYWQRGEYVGLGPGAHSFLDGVRSWNLEDLENYILMLKEGRLPEAGRELIHDRDAREEKIMLGLRLDTGVSADWIPEISLNHWLEHKWCELKSGRVVMREEGWLLLNELLASIEVDGRCATI